MNERYEQALKQREEARARLAPTIARMEAEGRLPYPLSKEQIEMLAKLEEECGGLLCGNPKDFLTESEEVVWNGQTPTHRWLIYLIMERRINSSKCVAFI